MTSNNKKIFVIGDLMLDEYIVGDNYHISDEAPVPILKVDDFIPMLGGAANVANNLKHLGCDVVLCGTIGEQSSGLSATRFMKEMEKQGLSTSNIVEGRIKTTTKSRVIIKDQQVVRFDYEDTSLPENIRRGILDKVRSLNFDEMDLIIVSDYRKGVITSEIMDVLRKTNVRIMVDPKPQNIDLYKGVFCMTPNLKEFNQILETNFSKGNVGGIIDGAKFLRKKFDINLIVITIGEKGAIYCHEDGADIIQPHEIEVTNMIGAGDTFISALCFAIVNGWNIGDSIKIANAAAAIAVSKKYTSICSRQDINNFLKRGNECVENGFLHWQI